MGIFNFGDKNNKENKDDNIQNNIVEDEKVNGTNETVIEENTDQKQEINCKKTDEQFNKIENDKCNNSQGQANEISEIKDEMRKISQCLENVMQTNTILNKKLLSQESKFSKNIEELKSVIIEEKNEEILELKRKIKAKENKENDDSKNILHIVDQIDAVYNFAVETDNKPLIESLEFTMKIVKKELSEIGIEEILALGEQFTTKLHECESAIIDDDKKENEIVKVIKKGYMKQGNLLRTAKVIAVRKNDKVGEKITWEE